MRNMSKNVKTHIDQFIVKRRKRTLKKQTQVKKKKKKYIETNHNSHILQFKRISFKFTVEQSFSDATRRDAMRWDAPLKISQAQEERERKKEIKKARQ